MMFTNIRSTELNHGAAHLFELISLSCSLPADSALFTMEAGMMPRGSALSTAMRRVSEVSACRLPGQDALLKRYDLRAVAGVIE